MPLGDYGPQFWFDASAGSSITLTGSGVSSWSDLSGNARHATQTTDASRPLLKLNDLGAPSVRFVGGRFLNIASPGALARNVGACTTILIGCSYGANAGASYPLSVSLSSGGVRLGATITNEGEWRASGRRLDNDGFSWTDTGLYQRANAEVVEFVHHYSAGQAGVGVAGGPPVMAAFHGSGPSQNTAAAAARLGRHNTVDEAWPGYLHEMALYHRLLTVAERAAIYQEARLKWFWTGSIEIGGKVNVSTTAGPAADKVVIIDALADKVVASTTPAENGEWTAKVPAGDYYIGYINEGCQPVLHGPYHVEPA